MRSKHRQTGVEACIKAQQSYFPKLLCSPEIASISAERPNKSCGLITISRKLVIRAHCEAELESGIQKTPVDLRGIWLQDLRPFYFSVPPGQ